MLLVISFSCLNVFSQEEGSRILVHSYRYDYLLPTIHSVLKKLKNVETGNNLFKNVTSLNQLITSAEADSILRNLLYYYDRDKKFIDSNPIVVDSIFNVFLKHDYFLSINQNVLVDNIELQFLLYKIVNPANNKEFPLKNLISPVSSSNIFINVKDEEYPEKITNAIKSVIKNTSNATSFNVSLLGNVKKNDTGYIVSSRDTFEVEIQDVFDMDTELDKIKFYIKHLESYNSSNRLEVFSGKNKNSIKLFYNGTSSYKFIVVANDGINESFSDTFQIASTTPATIYVPYKYLEHNFIPGFITGLYNKDFIYIYLKKEEGSSTRKVNFHVQVSNPNLKYSRSILDSVINEYANITSIIKTDLTKRRRLHNKLVDSVLLYKTYERINDSSRVWVEVFSHATALRNSLFVYGVRDGLRSNVEEVIVENTNLSFINFQVSTGLTRLFVRENICSDSINCTNGKKEKLDYSEILSARVNMFILNNINFYMGFGFAKSIQSTSTREIIAKGPNGFTNDFGISVNHLYNTPKSYYVVTGSVGYKAIGFRYDSSYIPPSENVGGGTLLNIGAGISSIPKRTAAGYFFRANYLYYKKNGTTFHGVNMSFGLTLFARRGYIIHRR
jgi:hypothetical protein